jgi:eukaryotic-like serine/threonine-protein kinase
MVLAPGTQLGPYEIESLIDSGGMGEVYKARDGRLNRTVAIKWMIADDNNRFQSEARAIAAINHPHICQIYDIGPDYLVLEYFAGEPLGGPVSRDEAVQLASQIADALQAAHERGILHRDLKPANVMVLRQGGALHAKLLDFGVARLASSDIDATGTLAGAVVGTPAYMSPEQAAGKSLDARSDVFSFGAVLYELLAGTRALHGRLHRTVLSAVLRDDPCPFEAPNAVRQIVKRCLAKDPDRRFQTMADVKQALQHLTRGSADVAASIAVLPFANLSADRENEYFGDGLAEEIINALAQLRD